MLQRLQTGTTDVQIADTKSELEDKSIRGIFHIEPIEEKESGR